MEKSHALLVVEILFALAVLDFLDLNPKMRNRVMKAFELSITAIKEGLKELADKPRSRSRTKK